MEVCVMYNQVMDYYGLSKDFDKSNFFMTENYENVLKSVKLAIKSGGLIALTGIVGIGKTSTLRRIQKEVTEENNILVAKSLTTDKKRVNINTLYTALFSDLSVEKDFKIPTQSEIRERKLQGLFKKLKKPVALFIDEAHQLHWRTFIALKHLIETIEDGGAKLAIVLVGHPILANELKNPKMEEIGERSKLFSLDGMGENKKRFVEWILKDCSNKKQDPYEIFSKEAVDLLCERLVTPLQFSYYMKQALEKGHLSGEKPISDEVIKNVISPELNSIEPNLARYGYNLSIICEHLNVRRSEIMAYFKGQLNSARTEEFNKEIQKLGVING
jgi:type II secretory pathway predicted ATPase ExeA